MNRLCGGVNPGDAAELAAVAAAAPAVCSLAVLSSWKTRCSTSWNASSWISAGPRSGEDEVDVGRHLQPPLSLSPCLHLPLFPAISPSLRRLICRSSSFGLLLAGGDGCCNRPSLRLSVPLLPFALAFRLASGGGPAHASERPRGPSLRLHVWPSCQKTDKHKRSRQSKTEQERGGQRPGKQRNEGRRVDVSKQRVKDQEGGKSGGVCSRAGTLHPEVPLTDFKLNLRGKREENEFNWKMQLA